MKGRSLSYYQIVILILAILPAPAVVDIVVDVVAGPNSGFNLGEDDGEVTVRLSNCYLNISNITCSCSC